MKIQTSTLTGAQLDYHVARAEGFSPFFTRLSAQGRPICTISAPGDYGGEVAKFYRPSTDWAQGGPLIEKYRSHFCSVAGGGYKAILPMTGWCAGDTPLQAICRAVVRAAFGDEVEEVPVSG